LKKIAARMILHNAQRGADPHNIVLGVAVDVVHFKGLVQDAGKLLVPFRTEVEHEYAALMIEGQFNVADKSLVHAKFTQAPLEFTAFVARQIAIGQLFERIHYLLGAKFTLVKNDHLRSSRLRRLNKQLVVRVFIAVPVNRGRRFEHSGVSVENSQTGFLQVLLDLDFK